MKTPEEFNEKYSKWLEVDSRGRTFDGISLENEEALNYLDNKFQEFIKRPEFQFSQIKAKFDWFCFYAKGVTSAEVNEIEKKLKEIYNTKK